MTYLGKPYEELLKEALEDEAQAGNMYRNMADMAPGEEAANAIRAIAADEDRHYRILSYLSTVASMSSEQKAEYTERMEYALGHRQPSQAERLFPQTASDWEDLGYDIEAKLPDIGEKRYSVRDAVAIATGNKEGDADEAKRWLVRKAKELGIS